jgi:carbonic anhydrase
MKLSRSFVLGGQVFPNDDLCNHLLAAGFTLKRAIRVLLAVTLMVSLTLQAMPQSAEHREDATAPSPDQIWISLVKGNRRFIDGRTTHRDLVSQRRTLKTKQHPLVAVLSCSDSRVPPEVVFDQGLGDLFVVRVAGNSSDPTGAGSLEYAVEHLGTVMIVVLGHQNCGAVTAACSGEKMPTLNLEAVVQPIAQSCSVARQEHAGESLVEAAIRDHVHRTAEELLAQSPLLKHAHDEGKLTIVEAYYSLSSGAVTKLH